MSETSRFGRYADLAHDTLITGWPELAGWIVERREDLQTQRRLETRAATCVLLTSSELPRAVTASYDKLSGGAVPRMLPWISSSTPLTSPATACARARHRP